MWNDKPVQGTGLHVKMLSLFDWFDCVKIFPCPTLNIVLHLVAVL